MKVTVENKKGLNKDLKVFIDKKTMNSYMDEKYEEIKGNVNLKDIINKKNCKKLTKNCNPSYFNKVSKKYCIH